MKKLLRIIGFLLLILIALVFVTFSFFQFTWSRQVKTYVAKLGEEVQTLEKEGHSFRDLNKNGQLDVYEDHRAPLEHRLEDLLKQMTLEEKAGSMFITFSVMHSDGSLINKPTYTGDPMSTVFSAAFPSSLEMMVKYRMNHFNNIQPMSAEVLATWNNELQKMAEKTRLGIPVTIASDPRHAAGDNPGVGIKTPAFSPWPGTLGLAATRDTNLVREFGDIARQEYLACGIRVALHPMADLATEPRWARANGTFGEDAELSAQMTKAYILGFQGDSLTNQSVACMTKHFSGGGPQKDGEDAHFHYGKEQVYPGGQFDYHLIPFEKGAFPAQSAQMMPYYGIPVGQTSEEVAFGYNKDIITGLLREKYGFNGVICTDWKLVTGNMITEAKAWGVEALTEKERIKKIIEAGCDMFGGEYISDVVVELVNEGQLSEARIDESVRRILRDKFRLGLFDDPYVDVKSANEKVSTPEFNQKGYEAQVKSLVLLKNENDLLPLSSKTKIYVEGFDKELAKEYAEVVDQVAEADIVLKHLLTPFEPRNGEMLERMFHAGRLNFTEEEKAPVLSLIRQKPAVVGITLERAAIIPEIAESSQALIADFAVSDRAYFDIIFGKAKPSGKLPIELPSSAEAVEAQLEDVPYDTKDPLFPFGFGLAFK